MRYLRFVTVEYCTGVHENHKQLTELRKELITLKRLVYTRRQTIRTTYLNSAVAFPLNHGAVTIVGLKNTITRLNKTIKF
jgi:hypothetical protein